MLSKLLTDKNVSKYIRFLCHKAIFHVLKWSETLLQISPEADGAENTLFSEAQCLKEAKILEYLAKFELNIKIEKDPRKKIVDNLCNAVKGKTRNTCNRIDLFNCHFLSRYDTKHFYHYKNKILWIWMFHLPHIVF